MSMMSIEQSSAILEMESTRDAIKAIVDALPEDELADACVILMQYARTDRRRQKILARLSTGANK